MADELDYKKLYEEVRRENQSLKQQVSIAMQKVEIYENDDLEKEGYYTLKSLIKQQIDVVKDFKLKEEISKNPKDDKFYDRVKAIGEGLKPMITDLKALKIELKISDRDDKQNKYQNRTSPESVAESLNNTAGQSN